MACDDSTGTSMEHGNDAMAETTASSALVVDDKLPRVAHTATHEVLFTEQQGQGQGQ